MNLGITEGSSITVGNLTGTSVYGSVDNISITTYLTQPAVQYQSGVAGLNQILQQKYIVFWQTQTGKHFSISAEKEFLLSLKELVVVIRLQYPRTEADANAVNYNAAVQCQFNGADDLNGKLWIHQ